MWSRWFNVDSAEGDGDYETLLKIKRKYPEVLCDSPISVQGRVTGSDQVLLHADEFNQRVELNPRVGLVCKNIGQHCKNYEVRFCCSKGTDQLFSFYRIRQTGSGFNITNKYIREV